MADDPANIALVLFASSAVKVLGAWWIRRKKIDKFELVGKVSALNLYPVKSCKGIPLTEATATNAGLKHDDVTDRHWLVTRANGDFVTLRQFPTMALITLTIESTCIRLDAPGMPSFSLPKSPTVNPLHVKMTRVWGSRVEALDCGDKAASWISKYLQDDGLRMFVSPTSFPKRDSSLETKPWGNPALPGDIAAFADFGGYLVVSEESLDFINQKLEKKVEMANFRPNIVFTGSDAFDEDNWKEIRIGQNVHMRLLDLCTRCTLTTVNPATGVKDANQEPLKTLKRSDQDMRKEIPFLLNLIVPSSNCSISILDEILLIRCFPPYGRDPCFGVNAALDISGKIQVGDPVYALKT